MDTPHLILEMKLSAGHPTMTWNHQVNLRHRFNTERSVVMLSMEKSIMNSVEEKISKLKLCPMRAATLGTCGGLKKSTTKVDLLAETADSEFTPPSGVIAKPQSSQATLLKHPAAESVFQSQPLPSGVIVIHNKVIQPYFYQQALIEKCQRIYTSQSIAALLLHPDSLLHANSDSHASAKQGFDAIVEQLRHNCRNLKAL